MAKNNSIDSLKPWRWSNTLSVVDAAILMCLENPDDYFQSSDGERQRMMGQPEDYIASFRALTFAIEKNEIQASIVHSIRSAQPRNKDHENVFDDLSSTNEVEVTYDMLINRNANQTDLKTENTGQTLLNFNLSEINSKNSFYITQKPNWELTTVQFADMKKWFENKNEVHPFFSPNENIESFRSIKHPRYSSKLACVVAAWEAFTSVSNNKNAKQTLEAWILKNGAQFGVGEKGNVTPGIAKALATIANWDISGGAIKTSTKDNNDSPEPIKEPVQNYKHSSKDR